MQGEQRRSHPPGLNSGPHRVVPCPPREDIRRVGGEAELHRHQLPEGVLGIAGIAIGGNQRLGLCLIPEKGSGAGVYAAEGLRGQVIVRILLPDVAVDKDHGVLEQRHGLIAAQQLQGLLIGGAHDGVIVPQLQLLGDIPGVHREKHVIQIFVPEQGLPLLRIKPVDDGGTGRIAVHGDLQLRGRLGVLLLGRVLELLGGLLAAGNCGSHHQGAKNQGAEHFRQFFHLIPPFMSGWMG